MPFTISGSTGINLGTQPLTGSLPDANAPSGSVIQVVSASTNTNVTTTSSTYSDTGLTASITPIATTSRILVIVSQQVYVYRGNQSATLGGVRLLRDSTVILNPYTDTGGPLEPYIQIDGGSSAYFSSRTNIVFTDSPTTTSSTTYKTQGAARSGSTMIFQAGGGSDPFRGTSTITLMEIAA